MPHTMFYRNRFACFREEHFLKGFAIYECGGHLGHVTSIMSSNFHFHVPESFHTKIGSERHSCF